MKTLTAVCIIFLALSSVLPLEAQSVPAQRTSQNSAAELISHISKVKGLQFASGSVVLPPTDDFCQANFGLPCPSPQEVRNAYGLTQLLNDGFTGAGQTIIIVDSFGSPTLASDLHSFDLGYGLPDPPSLKILTPLGTVPFDPTDVAQLGWAFETTLDVEWAHAMAPDANIVVLTSPVDETQGIQGMPEFLELENFALNHHLGKIISQSWGTAEANLASPEGQELINNFQQFYARAALQNVTVLAGTGDTGSAGIALDGASLLPDPSTAFPATSPLVTAVGGTLLTTDATGNYLSETTWNDFSGATGGGVSQRFEEPLYQLALPQSDQVLLNKHRGIPDVAFNAGAVLIYVGIFPDPSENGFFFTDGTSESSPQWAGMIADINQLAGHPMGFLNPRIYLLGALGAQDEFFHDITTGNNSFAGIPGFNATPGWDLTTGWGTPNMGRFASELAKH